MSTEPQLRYKQLLAQNRFDPDPAQQQAVAVFQQIYRALVETRRPKTNALTAFVHRLIPAQPPVRGLYLWGGVGRGKTWLMNLFFESLPFEHKLRLHFHHFMLEVHERLGRLNKHKNPLRTIAREYAQHYRVICLDEFIVTNITDAMMLYGLLDELFNQSVTLVATSNRVPDDLYKNGLQRDRFVPAIDLIKKYTTVHHLDGGIDHRLKLLEQSDVYYTPITEHSEQQLKQRMRDLATDTIHKQQTLEVLGRNVHAIACADEIAWFDFNVLCEAPRAAQDYIVLAKDYHTILLSNVPVMDEYQDDKARRFIYLVDELYDKNVKLIMSAQAAPDQLYTGDMLAFAFRRTASRLIEMRSEQYLQRPHAFNY